MTWLSDRLLIAARKCGATIPETCLFNWLVTGHYPDGREMRAKLDAIGAPRWPV